MACRTCTEWTCRHWVPKGKGSIMWLQSLTCQAYASTVRLEQYWSSAVVNTKAGPKCSQTALEAEDSSPEGVCGCPAFDNLAARRDQPALH